MTLTVPTSFSRTSKLSTIADPGDPTSRILKVSLDAEINLSNTNINLGNLNATPTTISGLELTPTSSQDAIALLKGLLLNVARSSSVGLPSQTPAVVATLTSTPATELSLIQLLKRIVLQVDSNFYSPASTGTSQPATAGASTTLMLAADPNRVGFSIFIPPAAPGNAPRAIRISPSALIDASNNYASVEIKEGVYYEHPVIYKGAMYMISKDGSNLSFNLTTFTK